MIFIIYSVLIIGIFGMFKLKSWIFKLKYTKQNYYLKYSWINLNFSFVMAFKSRKFSFTLYECYITIEDKNLGINSLRIHKIFWSTFIFGTRTYSVSGILFYSVCTYVAKLEG